MTAAPRIARRASLLVVWLTIAGAVAIAQRDESRTWDRVQYFGGAAGSRGNSPRADNTLTISPNLIQLRNKDAVLLFEISPAQIDDVDHLPDRYISLEYSLADCRRAAVLLRAEKSDLADIFEALMARQTAERTHPCPEQSVRFRAITAQGLAAKSGKALEVQLSIIEEILVLPAVDERNGPKADVKLDDIQTRAVNLLRKKKYVATAAAHSGEELIEDDLKEAKPEWVKGLGPANARWVMVVCLRDVMSKLTFGSTGNAEVSGYLYDKQEGTLIWYGQGIGQTGQGGLAGMALKGMMKGEALNGALSNLMRSVPKRRQAKK